VKTPLSERIRPNSEAAPWVIDEVKKLEKQVGHLLDLSKTLLQNFEPDRFVRVMMTREMLNDFQKLIDDIEGNKE
jgi:hypothetical protein